MNALSGYIELDMNGTVLPFKFGTNAWALFCEMHKIEFSDIADSGIFTSNFVALRDLFYCGHLAAARSKGEQPKVNLEAFGDLLDDTEGALVKLQEVLLTSRIMGFTLDELAAKGEIKKK